jgi:DNA invertase Pin-like site-specific DNA recombinase
MPGIRLKADIGFSRRLGRSLIDLLDFLRELHAKGVDLFLHQQGLDTSTPSGRAMFQMLARIRCSFDVGSC